MGNKKLKISSILLYAVLIFWLLITVIPILWVFENSFKPSEEILLNGVAFRKAWIFQLPFHLFVSGCEYVPLLL